MIKLGLAIQVTQTGNNGAKIINDDSWSRQIADLRELLPTLHNQGIHCYNTPALFSYTTEGMFITLLREIKGRDKDNSCAFIYIPKDTDISEDELYEVVCTVKNEIGKSSLDMQGLKDLFNREYRQKESTIAYKCSNTNGFAYRIVPNKYSLKELLGEERYQKYYTDFKYIFILEEQDFDKQEEWKKKDVDIELLTDITSKELETYCSLIPPTKSEIYHATQKEITLNLKNGQPFNQIIEGLKGKRIELIAERKGFDSFHCQHILSTQGGKIDLNKLNEIEWVKKISSDNFNIINQESKKRIEGCEILIDDKNISHSCISLEENQINHVKVTISHADFSPVTRHINFKTTEIAEIELVPKEKTYDYDIRLKQNYGLGKLSYTTRKEIRHGTSPLYFYNYKGGTLVFDEQKKKKLQMKYMGMGFIGGFIITMLISLIVILCWPSKSKSPDTRMHSRARKELPSEKSYLDMDDDSIMKGKEVQQQKQDMKASPQEPKSTTEENTTHKVFTEEYSDDDIKHKENQNE